MFRNVLVVVTAFAVGIALAFGYHVAADHATNADDTAAFSGRSPLGGSSASEGFASSGTPSGAIETAGAVPDADPAGPPASSAHDAVARFLDAEIAQDFGASYDVLSGSDRSALGSQAQWVADHGEMAPILAYRISGVTANPGRAAVTVDLELRPGLDQINGLIAARAVGTYYAVGDDRGWRVAYAESVLTPIYTADRMAPDAVRAWASDKQACRRPVQYSSGLLGAPRQADALCHATGPIRVGAPGPLPESDAAEPFLAAFGPAVYEWARVLRISAPAHLDVVVAPVGEQWLVIGALPVSTRSS